MTQKLIDATDIERYFEGPLQRVNFPELIQRLINATVRDASEIRECRFPSGNAGELPGWDGMLSLNGEQDYTFVPLGESRWELKTSKNIKRDADTDYATRSGDSSIDNKNEITYVCVTSKKWNTTGKGKWIKEKASKNEWKSVRVIDAVDIEQWLMTCPSVALWLGVRIGKNNLIDVDIVTFWENYASLFEKEIDIDFMICGRHEQAAAIVRKILHIKNGVIDMVSEDYEEAVAFVYASLMIDPSKDKALSNPDWNEDKRASIISKVIVLSDDSHPAYYAGIEKSIFITNSLNADRFGVLSKKNILFSIDSSSSDSKTNVNSICLERPMETTLYSNLIRIGIDHGTSWKAVRLSEASFGLIYCICPSQFAYQKAKNSIEKYLENISAHATAFLMGSWDSNNDFDRKMISYLYCGVYTNFEAFHNDFLQQHINVHFANRHGAWQAYNQNYFLATASKYIDRECLDRFKKIVEYMLCDDLEGEELSGRMKSGIFNTLVMLSRCHEFSYSNRHDSIVSFTHWRLKPDTIISSLNDMKVNGNFFRLIKYFDYFIEIIPEEVFDFIDANASMISEHIDKSNYKYQRESSHSNMIRGLECLATDAHYFESCIKTLKTFCDLNRSSNKIGRMYMGSMVKLLSPWFPATNADVALKKYAIKTILKTGTNEEWSVLCALASRRDTLNLFVETTRLKYSPVPSSYTRKEYFELVLFVFDRLIEYSNLSSNRIADLVNICGECGYVDASIISRVIQNIEYFILNSSEDEKEKLWEKLLEFYSLEQCLEKKHGPNVAELIAKIGKILPDIEPTDKLRLAYLKLKYERVKGIDALKTEDSINEWIRLIKIHGCEKFLAVFKGDNDTLSRFIDIVRCSISIDIYYDLYISMIMLEFDRSTSRYAFAWGFLQFKEKWIDTIAANIAESNYEATAISKIILDIPYCSITQNLFQSFGQEVVDKYWDNFSGIIYDQDQISEIAPSVVDELLTRNRPEAALYAIQHVVHLIDCKILEEVLRDLLESEGNNNVPSRFDIRSILDTRIPKNSDAGYELNTELLARIEIKYIIKLTNSDYSFKYLSDYTKLHPEFYLDAFTLRNLDDMNAYKAIGSIDISHIYGIERWNIYQVLIKCPFVKGRSLSEIEEWIKRYLDLAKANNVKPEVYLNGLGSVFSHFINYNLNNQGPCIEADTVQRLHTLLSEYGSNGRGSFYAGVSSGIRERHGTLSEPNYWSRVADKLYGCMISDETVSRNAIARDMLSQLAKSLRLP